MGSASDYLEDKVLDHLFGRTTYTAPATLYVGLWSTPLSDASTGASAGEINGTGYARVSVTNDVSNWPNASGGSKANAFNITFPAAFSVWGSVKTVAILDAATGGNVLFSSSLQPEVYVDTYDTFIFAPGDLTLALD